MVTNAKQWKKNAHELTLPSGNVCLAKRIGLDVLMRTGKVPNSLLPALKGAMKGKSLKSSDVMDIDEDMITDMMALFDTVTLECVLEPEVAPVPEDESKRDEEVLYVDDVDVNDKQFIFQWAVGGTASVEKFREQSGQLLDTLLSGEEVGQAPQ